MNDHVVPYLFYRPERSIVGDPNPFYDDGIFYVYYLWEGGTHPWVLTKTKDALRYTKTVIGLETADIPTEQDYWLGSGSVLKGRDGKYHLFYTGHNPDPQWVKDGNPREATMHAVSDDLQGWLKLRQHTFTASNGYDSDDFRDPFVFWHEDEGQYWMLLTTRYKGKAVVGLYTSDDLARWRWEEPIYAEDSPLNLEVPDVFKMNGRWYMLFSDQRDESRQVRYRIAHNPRGPWWSPTFDALDGLAYYAGRTATDGKRRYMFGWVALKRGETDTSERFGWGGDLFTHEVITHDDGTLGVRLPEAHRDYLGEAVPLAGEVTSGAVLTLHAGGEQALGTVERPLRATAKARLLDGAKDFGIFIRNEETGSTARLHVLTDENTLSFRVAEEPTDADPHVSIPLEGVKEVDLELLLGDTAGVLYVNDEKALSFRLYDMAGRTVGLFSRDGLVEWSNVGLYAPVE